MQQVVITNQTRGTCVANAAEQASTFWSRGRGLLGRSHLAPDGGLVIVPCSNIHMLGMRFAIDVVFLDRSGHVLKLVPDCRPWRPFAGALRAYTTLELPVGAITASRTEVGDLVVVEPGR
ncbi:MAG: DUF192 domain-containing protein [Herpetosiphon sp.]